MRLSAVALLAVAFLLGGARMLTGLVYGADEPVSYLVLKRAPDAIIERIETVTRPAGVDHVLAQDELSLPYAQAYIALMRAAPAAVALTLSMAILLLVADRRRRAAA